MMIPLMVLAFFSVTAGWIGKPFAHFLEPVFLHISHPQVEGVTEGLLIVLYGVLAVGAFGIMWVLDKRQTGSSSTLRDLLFEGYYFDQLYRVGIVQPFYKGLCYLERFLDKTLIDQFLVDGTGYLFPEIGKELRKFQRGYLREYAVTVLFGTILIIVYFSFPVLSQYF